MARCGTSDAAAVSALIAEIQPVVEYAVEPACLECEDTGLRATLELALLEIVCGEYLVSRSVAVPTLPDGETVPPPDPSGWRAQGWRRLEPFRRASARTVRFGGGPEE
jgi:hypothetical protein